MAGGNITRIVGGKHSIETEEWIVYTDKFTAYAGQGSHFTAEKGTVFGSPKVLKAGKYFDKGWWSFDFAGNNKITNSKVGETVYFQIEMTKRFPETDLQRDNQNIISFDLFQYDGNDYKPYPIFILVPIILPKKIPRKGSEISYYTWDDKKENNVLDPEEEYSKKPYENAEAKGNKVVIKFQLGKGLTTYFNKIALLELFMSVSYAGETLFLPEDEIYNLDVEPNPLIKEIYVRLLNYQPPKNVISILNDVGGNIQSIHGNEEKMSDKVNMDYFSVRIDELPSFAKNDIKLLYKIIRKNFNTF